VKNRVQNSPFKCNLQRYNEGGDPFGANVTDALLQFASMTLPNNVIYPDGQVDGRGLHLTTL
jgi:hypothetical protein